MPDVHLNVFLTEFEEAHKEALAAVGNLYDKAHALAQKLSPESQAAVAAVKKEVANIKSGAKAKKQKPASNS